MGNALPVLRQLALGRHMSIAHCLRGVGNSSQQLQVVYGDIDDEGARGNSTKHHGSVCPYQAHTWGAAVSAKPGRTGVRRCWTTPQITERKTTAIPRPENPSGYRAKRRWSTGDVAGAMRVCLQH
eukprot:CAMPEP_0114324064 /NCGR_PEP_ID=MMETSP0059-20121206/28287_1 /TAXON_ID=36894 /ORGANISM="Pyramimonas parkeae, Strain CCMP726" /LENGTH=124 /DNA_ID=CAMNT_0001452537 /DNA_START=151 /DNA_END=523 /DNA_ORIENTATION=-